MKTFSHAVSCVLFPCAGRFSWGDSFLFCQEVSMALLNGGMPCFIAVINDVKPQINFIMNQPHNAYWLSCFAPGNTAVSLIRFPEYGRSPPSRTICDFSGDSVFLHPEKQKIQAYHINDVPNSARKSLCVICVGSRASEKQETLSRDNTQS